MAANPTRRAAGAALVAFCLAGCGGSAERPEPRLPHALAADLAAASDRVAARLAADDACGAQTAAQQLQQQTIAAINDGRVPPAFQEELSSAVGSLVLRIPPCAPPVEEQPEHEKEKDKGKHKGKKH